MPWAASTWLARNTSLAGSSQCRSSNRVTPGSRALWARTRRLVSSSSWRWRASGSMRGAGRSGSGTARKSKISGRSSPKLSSSSSSLPAIRSRAVWSESSSVMSKYDAQELEHRQQRDRTSRAPGRRRGRRECPSPGSARANSSQSRLLPTPASPTIPITCAWPASACSRALSSTRSSSSRPTKREKPRARETSRRPRAAPTPVSSWTRSGPAGALDLELAEVGEREVALDERRRVLA